MPSGRMQAIVSKNPKIRPNQEFVRVGLFNEDGSPYGAVSNPLIVNQVLAAGENVLDCTGYDRLEAFVQVNQPGTLSSVVIQGAAPGTPVKIIAKHTGLSPNPPHQDAYGLQLLYRDKAGDANQYLRMINSGGIINHHPQAKLPGNILVLWPDGGIAVAEGRMPMPGHDSSLLAINTTEGPKSTRDYDYGGYLYPTPYVRVIEANSATPVTLTITKDDDAHWPYYWDLDICQIGTGQITVVGDSGVALRAPQGKASVKTISQWATINIRMRKKDEWVASGNLA